MRRVSRRTRGTVLCLAASVERGSEHRLAAAIVPGAVERGDLLESADEFASVTGNGVRGTVAGRRILPGNLVIRLEDGVDFAIPTSEEARARVDG